MNLRAPNKGNKPSSGSAMEQRKEAKRNRKNEENQGSNPHLENSANSDFTCGEDDDITEQ